MIKLTPKELCNMYFLNLPDLANKAGISERQALDVYQRKPVRVEIAEKWLVGARLLTRHQFDFRNVDIKLLEVIYDIPSH